MNHMTQSASSLSIKQLELYVYLGWPDLERHQEQAVLLDVDIWFPKPPKACVTDNLDDTFCYSTLIAGIRDKVANKNFHLIEHLNHEIYQFVKSQLPDQSKIIVRITKHPKIRGFTGSVCFSYWDEK